MFPQPKRLLIILQPSIVVWKLSIRRSDVIPTARKSISEIANIAIWKEGKMTWCFRGKTDKAE